MNDLTPPPGIPRPAWLAARDLVRQFHNLNAGAILESTSLDEAHDRLCRKVAEVIASHISKHRKMVEGVMEVGR